MKSRLEINDIEIYSTHNEGKSVVAERFIRTLRNKIYKYKTSISKNVNIDKLDDIVNKYNNTYHKTVKMEPADVKDNTYIIFGKYYFINDLNVEEIVGTFYEKEFQKTNQKEFRIEKLVKKGNKLYVKWKVPKPYEPFGGEINSMLIYLIMQQKQI